MEEGTGNSRAQLLAEIESAAKRLGTSSAELERSGNTALLREIEAAAVARQQNSGLRALAGPGTSTGNAELLSQIQAAGAQRAAVPQAEAVTTTVLQAMSVHSSNAGIQVAGCSALWSMAYQNPYNRAAMGQQGRCFPVPDFDSGPCR